MKRFFFLLFLVAVSIQAAVTNWKSGIDVTFGGVEGTDFAEEYFYHNKPVCDYKVVFIRDATAISMAHNARNIASKTSRQRVVIGAAGGGIIRYAFDKMWSRLKWSTQTGDPMHPTTAAYPDYTGSFTLAGSTYEPGVPVVGTTGGRPGFPITDKANFYWRGIVDTFGDEWHVLKYADDDSVIGSPGDPDSWSSDGKWFMMVVNPKTPCLTVAPADATGQFYTTPPYVYFMPLIHDQTTYFQGNCNFTIHDIYGNNVHYKINGGSFVNPGSDTAVLTQADFTTGSNTLIYYYGASGAQRTRIIVKNPAFPSAGEAHGNLLWVDAAGYSTVVSRLSRSPYIQTYSTYSTDATTGQTAWDSLSGQGYRLGGDVAAWTAGNTSPNAMQARVLGFTAKRTVSSPTYADYAKSMLIESGITTPDLGWELLTNSSPQPSPEKNYRGYWDTNLVPAFAYDILIAGYKTTDGFVNGITPIEDYFIRDTMAFWCHLSGMWLGGHQDLGAPTMAGTSRGIGSTWITIAMPSYSTPYYGTSGMDGNTTVYTWAPFQTTNYTWKRMFLQNSYTLGAYPNAPKYTFGLEGNTSDDLCRNNGDWGDKAGYSVTSQMGHWVGLFRNLATIYDPGTAHANLNAYLNAVTIGTCTALKAPVGQFRRASPLVLNQRYMTPSLNAQTWCQNLVPADTYYPTEYYINGVQAAGILGLSLYDDGSFGIIPPAPPTSVTATTLSQISIKIDWVASVDPTDTYTIERSAHNAGIYTNAGSVADPTVTFTDTGLAAGTAYDYRIYSVKSLAHTGYSNVATATTQYTPILSNGKSGPQSPNMVGLP